MLFDILASQLLSLHVQKKNKPGMQYFDMPSVITFNAEDNTRIFWQDPGL